MNNRHGFYVLMHKGLMNLSSEMPSNLFHSRSAARWAAKKHGVVYTSIRKVYSL